LRKPGAVQGTHARRRVKESIGDLNSAELFMAAHVQEAAFQKHEDNDP
jgi:hypothetical protein